jgi:hypothetical protein
VTGVMRAIAYELELVRIDVLTAMRKSQGSKS